jgi:hypothetical protein
MNAILRPHCFARVALTVALFAGSSATAHGQIFNRLIGSRFGMSPPTAPTNPAAPASPVLPPSLNLPPQATGSLLSGLNAGGTALRPGNGWLVSDLTHQGIQGQQLAGVNHQLQPYKQNGVLTFPQSTTAGVQHPPGSFPGHSWQGHGDPAELLRRHDGKDHDRDGKGHDHDAKAHEHDGKGQDHDGKGHDRDAKGHDHDSKSHEKHDAKGQDHDGKGHDRDAKGHDRDGKGQERHDAKGQDHDGKGHDRDVKGHDHDGKGHDKHDAKGQDHDGKGLDKHDAKGQNHNGSGHGTDHNHQPSWQPQHPGQGHSPATPGSHPSFSKGKGKGKG